MALPHFLSTAYRYIRVAAVVDVQTIMDNLCTELVALGWTITAGGVGVTPTTFKSPVVAGDSSNCWVTVTLTRTAATRLGIVAFDSYGIKMTQNQLGNSIALDVDVAGNFVSLFTGPNHLCIDSERPGAFETWYIAVIDKYPEPNGSPVPLFICAKGPRRGDTGALVAADQTWDATLCMGPANTDYNVAKVTMKPEIPSNTMNLQTITGKYRLQSQELLGYSVGSTFRVWYGRLPHVARVSFDFAYGVDVTLPVDVGVNATFRVVGLIGAAASGNCKLAFTKAIV